MGVGVGVNPDDVQRLGWVDSALAQLGEQRRIPMCPTLPGRHDPSGGDDLIVTLPARATRLQRDNPRVVVREVPFEVPPLELKMAWSPLLQHSPAHRWARQMITGVARELAD